MRIRASGAHSMSAGGFRVLEVHSKGREEMVGLTSGVQAYLAQQIQRISSWVAPIIAVRTARGVLRKISPDLVAMDSAQRIHNKQGVGMELASRLRSICVCQKWRRANERPDPLFRYLSSLCGRALSLRPMYACNSQGLNLFV